jgi:hypothetical protein
MRTLACLAAAGMFALSAPSARADQAVYGEAFDTLYRIDLATHSAVEVGPAGSYGAQPIANISGLSYSLDNTLYAAAGGMNSLARIDPGSGRATVIGSFGLTGQGDQQANDALDLSMQFDCDGTLWLVSAYANKLWTVDPSTGATKLVGDTGRTITGLAVRGNVLFGAGGRGDNGFYRLDPESGRAIQLGSFGDDRWINSVSMSFDDEGTLWAVVNYIPPAPGSTTVPDWSDLARINTSTGKITFVGPITGPESLRQVGMKGFVIDPPRCVSGAVLAMATPVGTPPWLIGLALLLVGVAGFSLRRRFPA